MIDARVVEMLRKQLELEFKERDEHLRHSLAQTAFGFSNKGTLQSSAHVTSRIKLIRQEFKIRAGIMLARLKSTATTFGVFVAATDGLAFLGNQLEVQRLRLHGYLLGQSPKPSPEMFKSFDVEGLLGEMSRHERDNLEVQLQLWEAQMSRPKEMQYPTTSVNVTGNGNVVQAGIYGSTVSITLTGDAREKIGKGIQDLRAALQRPDVAAQISVQDVQGLMDDVDRELGATVPSGMKLGTYLSGIATAIQTVPSLRECYDLLADGLALMGVNLPRLGA